MDEWAQLRKTVEVTARRVEATPDEREDLVQEVLLRLWSRRDDADDRSPSFLVRTVLRRLRIDRWRARRVHEPLEESDVADRGGPPNRGLEREELAGIVVDAVALLSDEHQEVVRLRVEQGMTFRDIARREGISINTALARMHRAAGAIRKTVEEYLGSP